MDIERGLGRKWRRSGRTVAKFIRKPRYKRTRGSNMMRQYGVLKNESKYFNDTVNIENIGLADQNILPNFKVTQGDGAKQRIGNRIFVKSVTLMITVTLEKALTFRYIIYKNQNHTLTPSNAQVNSTYLINYSDWSGYTILDDKTINITKQLTSDNQRRMTFKKYLPINQYWSFNGETLVNQPGCPMIRVTSSGDGLNGIFASFRLAYTD